MRFPLELTRTVGSDVAIAAYCIVFAKYLVGACARRNDLSSLSSRSRRTSPKPIQNSHHVRERLSPDVANCLETQIPQRFRINLGPNPVLLSSSSLIGCTLLLLQFGLFLNDLIASVNIPNLATHHHESLPRPSSGRSSPVAPSTGSLSAF